MKRTFTLLLVLTLFFACVPEDHVLEIEIVNQTAEPVTDIELLTASDRVSFKADVLPAGQEITHTLQVPGNNADGQYTFRFSRNGVQETATGSYLEEEEEYLKKILIFEIQEQSVNVEQEVLEAE